MLPAFSWSYPTSGQHMRFGCKEGGYESIPPSNFIKSGRRFKLSVTSAASGEVSGFRKSILGRGMSILRPPF